MILDSIAEARAAGARLQACCELIGIDVRTIQRWQKRGPNGGKDRRAGPTTRPHNKLSEQERAKVIKIVTSPEFRDLSPKQIVPILAERGVYVASESTIQRILREDRLSKHRGKKSPPKARPIASHIATGPNQVWSWDITYLRCPIRGSFYYLYLFIDVWSRKIVGWRVEDREDSKLAAAAIESICKEQNIDSGKIVLHSDNGGPMTGYTMVAKLEELGVQPSLSRPRVSNDNAFSESMFGTLKTHPGFPDKPFRDLEHARKWVSDFVLWYNAEHRHSGISYVTPNQRHEGAQEGILLRREATYLEARSKHPERWSRSTRVWDRNLEVKLNANSKKLDTTTRSSVD